MRLGVVLCALRAIGACALLVLCACAVVHAMCACEWGHNMLCRHRECVRVRGPVQVSGTLTEDPPRPHQIPLPLLTKTSPGS
jgi:hypothetical protein